MIGREYFISGIDTNCGKTYITGLLALKLLHEKKQVITTKLVQTGCKGISEDILEHRRLMEFDVLPEDQSGKTCPFVFSFPASPHLAARLENKTVELSTVRNHIDQLKNNYEIILSEGAGGLMVPISENYRIADYILEYKLPLILVSSSNLGSLNHTLLSLEWCKYNRVNLVCLVFNQFPDADTTIADESYRYLKLFVENEFKSEGTAP